MTKTIELPELFQKMMRMEQDRYLKGTRNLLSTLSEAWIAWVRMEGATIICFAGTRDENADKVAETLRDCGVKDVRTEWTTQPGDEFWLVKGSIL